MLTYKQGLLKARFFSLCLLACFPLLGMRGGTLAIALFAFLSVLCIGFHWRAISFEGRGIFGVYLGLFSLILIRTIVLDNSDTSNFYLERSMSLLIFPLLFFLSPYRYTSKERSIVFFLFTFATIVITFYGELAVLLQLMDQVGVGKHWANRAQMMQDAAFSLQVRTIFENYSSFHPSYACLYLGICVILVMYFLLRNFSQLNWVKKLGLVFILLLLVTLQVILAARTPFAGTLVAAFLLFVLMQKKKFYVLIAGLSLIALIGLAYLFVPSFANRFKEVSVQNTSVPTAGHEDSFNLRSGIFKCSRNLVKEHWLLGVGPGNVQKHLNNCYEGYSSTFFRENEFNTHNQFLDYWAGLGILGPLVLISLLVIVSYANLKSGSFMPLAVCILFCSCMLTENILVRQYGVVAFAFFMSLFSFKPQKTN